jgi:hypothetical protein
MNIAKLQQAHDTQNAAYISAKTADNEALKPIANERLDNLLADMKKITKISAVNYVDAVDLFVSFFDDVVIECAELTNRRTEIEEAIIAMCKKALKKPTTDGARSEKDEHVTAQIIDCLNAEPSEEVHHKLVVAILDDTNPLRLGLSSYLDFCEKNPTLAHPQIFDYLQTEASVRASLIKGDDAETFAGLEKLLASPVNVPEKYLLTSLNSFYHGYDKDAIRALDIGLTAFPSNERLLNAKNALVAN